MKSKILSIFEKALSIVLLIISILVIYFYLDANYFNPGVKGISMKDLSQICILFSVLYILKAFFKRINLYISVKEYPKKKDITK